MKQPEPAKLRTAGVAAVNAALAAAGESARVNKRSKVIYIPEYVDYGGELRDAICFMRKATLFCVFVSSSDVRVPKKIAGTWDLIEIYGKDRRLLPTKRVYSWRWYSTRDLKRVRPSKSELPKWKRYTEQRLRR